MTRQGNIDKKLQDNHRGWRNHKVISFRTGARIPNLTFLFLQLISWKDCINLGWWRWGTPVLEWEAILESHLQLVCFPFVLRRRSEWKEILFFPLSCSCKNWNPVFPFFTFPFPCEIFGRVSIGWNFIASFFCAEERVFLDLFNIVFDWVNEEKLLIQQENYLVFGLIPYVWVTDSWV